MKKIMALLIMATMLIGNLPVIAHAEELELMSPSCILMEAATGTVIYEKNPDEILKPASVTKVMTLLLIYDALEEGRISKEDVVTISANAAAMGGSQVYLESNEQQTVDTLIKCISVASANDAAVAMAEYIAGSEEAFVDRMNERAKALGMKNTHFVNCCGLDTEEHVTTARDIAIMSRELIIRYPDIHNYSMIWMDSITHVTKKGETEFGLTNTNKLIKQYQWATGLKTGSTSQAKCCLSATAKKDNVELIAVIMAANSSKIRFEEAAKLLNYGFSTCNLYIDDNPPALENITIAGGKKREIQCEYEDNFKHLFTTPFEAANITSSLELKENLCAPIEEGDCVGYLVYSYNQEKVGRVPIIAKESVEEVSYGYCLLKILKVYFYVENMT